jgi:hypothetical protein
MLQLWRLAVAVAVGGGLGSASSSPAASAATANSLRRRPSQPCSCAEQKWCSPLSTPPPEHEIYAFAVTNYAGMAGGAGGVEPSAAATTTQQWPHFNWDLVTTVAWDIGANETVCYAHQHGVRVVIPAAGPFGLYGGAETGAYLELLLSPANRTLWVAETLASVAAAGADGVVFENREKQIGGSGGSLEPPGPLLEPPLAPSYTVTSIPFIRCIRSDFLPA